LCRSHYFFNSLFFNSLFFNSLFFAIATVMTVAIAFLAAFAFARYKFPLKEVIFYIFLASVGMLISRNQQAVVD
jgi:ABC-type glycerol-3-phosphate transport system permease component